MLGTTIALRLFLIAGQNPPEVPKPWELPLDVARVNESEATDTSPDPAFASFQQDGAALQAPGRDWKIATKLTFWYAGLAGGSLLPDEIPGSKGDDDLEPRLFLGDGSRLGDSHVVPGLEVTLGALSAPQGSQNSCKERFYRLHYWRGDWRRSYVRDDPLDLGTCMVPAGSRVKSEFVVDHLTFTLGQRHEWGPPEWSGGIIFR